jgi:hypothetical protein
MLIAKGKKNISLAVMTSKHQNAALMESISIHMKHERRYVRGCFLCKPLEVPVDGSKEIQKASQTAVI